MAKSVFPLIEVLGYASASPQARAAAKNSWCRFANTPCEKLRQYGFGYCSVVYAAADDKGVSQVYAVCDHRLDGDPLQHVVRDYFGKEPVELVPEIVLTQPRTSFDYVAVSKKDPARVIAIETQAIDIRGGGVGPAWRSWVDSKEEHWRRYFTEEAETKGRKDTIAYGVNMANIYKRLGLQVAVKGQFLKGIKVPFYILMQHRPFEYLRKRIPFDTVDSDHEISFVTFDYTGKQLPDGTLEFVHCATIRTTVEKYSEALSSDKTMTKLQRSEFLDRVKRKASLL